LDTKVVNTTIPVKVIMLLMIINLAGCASITLGKWNEEFEEEHQRSIEFDKTSIAADYLGKLEGAYVYRTQDSKKQTVVFRLPAKENGEVIIDLDDSESSISPSKTAMFHFDGTARTQESESDFPQNVKVFTSAFETNFRYSCRDGAFDNTVRNSIGTGIKCDQDEKNCHGLSSSDSFKLGMRKAGYLVAVPLDVATLPITLPLALIFMSTYCGPFGCP